MNYVDFFSQLKILIDPQNEKLEFRALGNLEQNSPSKIIGSIVNFEEDRNRRNRVSIRRQDEEIALLEQSQVFYLLFASDSQNSIDYIAGIQSLSEINAFFQANPILQIPDGTNQHKKVLAEWVSLNWEQQFYLWKSLGVRQLPYFLYKFSEI